VQADRKQQLGRVARSPKNVCFNYQAKMQGIMHFYCEELIVARNRDRGEELIDPCVRGGA